jgi:homoserine kinase
VSWRTGPVTVRVPATSANLGPGFDSFGLALGLHDLVTAEITPGGLTIEVTGTGAETADAGEQHLVLRAMRAAFAWITGAAGSPGQPPGLALSCQNAIPQGYGLGSSAAAIAAGLLAGRALAGDAGPAALPDDQVFRLATELEGHPDNVAACLAGGLTIAWTPEVGDGSGSGPAGEPRSEPGSGPGSGSGSVPGSGPRVARLSPLPDIAPVLCVPATPLPTVTARQVLPAEIPHAAAAANSARAALLVTALTRDPSLLLDGTADFLHQRYRAAVMPATARLLGRLRAAGVPAVVSGAGPSVLAFTFGPAGPAAGDVAAIADADQAPWRVLALDVDTAGATILAR